MGKRYWWLKLPEDFFRHIEIKKLRRVAGGDTYALIYEEMMLLSLRTDGVLQYDCEIDDFIDNLAIDLDEDVENVRMTVAYLEQCKLLRRIDDSSAELLEVAEMTGSETAVAERVRNFRKRKALQCNTDVTPCNDNVTPVKRLCNVEIEIEKELELEKEIDKAASTNVSAALSARTHTHAREDAKQQREENVFRLWEENISPLTAIVGEKLRDLLDEVGEAAVKRGIERAVERGSRNFSYIAAVARREASGQSGYTETIAEREERWKREQEAVDTLSRHATRARGGTKNG
jgi:predicted phage replisome organizer